jgi:hypothetical protein
MSFLQTMAQLPEMIREIEAYKKRKLSDAEIGRLLKEIGEAIEKGELTADRTSLVGPTTCESNSLNYIPCSNPRQTRTSGQSDIICCC